MRRPCACRSMAYGASNPAERTSYGGVPMTQKRIVGLGGTTVPNSSTEKALRVVLKAAEGLGAATQIIDGPFLARLPLFAPESRHRTAAQTEFVEIVRQADGIVIATPAYHAGMSGLIKNAIDLLED